MEYNDRELLVYRIRSGVLTVKIHGQTLKVKPATIQGNLDACEEYMSVYDLCLAKGIPTQEDMLEWMMDKDLWSYNEERRITITKEAIEELKLSCYENRRNSITVNDKKNQIRALERRFKQLNDTKYKYYSSTCEGIASSAKNSFIIENNTFCEGQRYSFSKVSPDSILAEYLDFHNLEDNLIRFLARSEPWRTIWITRTNTSSPLFLNEPEIDLTINQRSILAWSQMYDNVYESMDCPDKYVIEDDDLLDGWFIEQTKKREKDKARQDLDHSIKNEKIRNSQEVFSVVNNVEEFKKVDSLNSTHSKIIQKQRENLIKQKGGVGQGAFHDEKLKYVAQQNKQFKGKFGGK